MKCPHCGMNIRDNIEVCGYCGGKIEHESETSPSGTGRPERAGEKGTKAAHALHGLVDVERRELRQALWREQTIHQGVQPIGLLHDHLGVLGQLGALELAFEELGGAAQAPPAGS